VTQPKKLKGNLFSSSFPAKHTPHSATLFFFSIKMNNYSFGFCLILLTLAFTPSNSSAKWVVTTSYNGSCSEPTSQIETITYEPEGCFTGNITKTCQGQNITFGYSCGTCDSSHCVQSQSYTFQSCFSIDHSTFGQAQCADSLPSLFFTDKHVATYTYDNQMCQGDPTKVVATPSTCYQLGK
jgi:hypothetical protein